MPRPSPLFLPRGIRLRDLPQLSSSAAALLILRLFIGLGWLRAFAEKAIDPPGPRASGSTTAPPTSGPAAPPR